MDHTDNQARLIRARELHEQMVALVYRHAEELDHGSTSITEWELAATVRLKRAEIRRLQRCPPECERIDEHIHSERGAAHDRQHMG